ncbi:disabled homolog 1-like isoform X2 [Dreissena polymorpha]|uniref:PID domain-containing protein n=1 Tax=Dreissena polymorpha TaxID=45954 RepID=A0A9D4M107_DREPO|nr:disabled homolog 1-like isoform X2 [Dreissena polymorpha]KAH3867408.1 hypothetical protein DPMN_030534 [Dreissena polymorpha]
MSFVKISTSEFQSTVESKAVDIANKTSKNNEQNVTSRFQFPGIDFTAKLIGIADVESARGEEMCQESMLRLKQIVKQSKQHKQKIIVNISLVGIRIVDTRTQAVQSIHEISKISFILRDRFDHRAFGYVYDAGDGHHKFYAVKTEKPADGLVETLRDLFQTVYQKKKKEEKEFVKHTHEESVQILASKILKQHEHVKAIQETGLITINVGQDDVGPESAAVGRLWIIADVCDGESEV